MPAATGPDCVSAALAGDPAFTNAQRIEGLPGMAADNPAWSYGENRLSILQLTRTRDGWELRNARTRLGTRPPEPELDRFSAQMVRINTTLAARCSLHVSRQSRN